MSAPQSQAQPSRPPRSKRRRRWFAAIAFSLSLVFSLAVAEFGARWYAEGSFLEAVDSVLGLRTAAAPGQEPHLVADPELGFMLNPAIEGVNAMGIRGPEDLANKRPGTYRILFIGDSVTFPHDGYVKTFTDALEASRPGRCEVINAATHGYTTYQERLFLQRTLTLKPDLVVVQWCVNDNFRFLHRLTSKGRRLMTLEAKNHLFPEDGGLLGWLSRTSYLVYGARKWTYAAAQEDSNKLWEHPLLKSAWDPASWVDAREHLHAMAAAARAAGARFAVLAVPHEHQLDAESLTAEPDKVLFPQGQLTSICDAEKIPFFDAHGAFVARRAAGLFEADRLHLSAPGHAVLGAALFEFVESLDWLPAK